MLSKAGMKPGESLILTKPVGTGTILAAQMQGAAKGRWVAAAVDNMIQSNGELGVPTYEYAVEQLMATGSLQ